MFKEYFIDKEGDEYKEVFDRLHVFSAEEFESELKRLLEKINSLIGSEFHEKNRERIQQEASQLRKS